MEKKKNSWNFCLRSIPPFLHRLACSTNETTEMYRNEDLRRTKKRSASNLTRILQIRSCTYRYGNNSRVYEILLIVWNQLHHWIIMKNKNIYNKYAHLGSIVQLYMYIFYSLINNNIQTHRSECTYILRKNGKLFCN